MSRRQSREVALQALFQLDLNQSAASNDEENQIKAVDAAAGEIGSFAAHDREYAKVLVKGARLHLTEIDAMITKSSREWKVERMSGVDRNITRVAVFEMKFSEEKLTPNIVINEAIELAKKFGTDDSGRFVNGILGAMVK